MTVLLEKDAEGLGVAGDLVEVKPAYAENFLVSKGVGIIATKEMIDKATAELEAKAAAAAAALKAAKDMAEKISSKFGKSGLKYEVQVAQDGTIKDVVTSVQIANEVRLAPSHRLLPSSYSPTGRPIGFCLSAAAEPSNPNPDSSPAWGSRLLLMISPCRTWPSWVPSSPRSRCTLRSALP